MEQQLLDLLNKWQKQSEQMTAQACNINTNTDSFTVNAARRLVAKATQLNECIADLQKLMLKEVVK